MLMKQESEGKNFASDFWNRPVTSNFSTLSLRKHTSSHVYSYQTNNCITASASNFLPKPLIFQCLEKWEKCHFATWPATNWLWGSLYGRYPDLIKKICKFIYRVDFRRLDSPNLTNIKKTLTLNKLHEGPILVPSDVTISYFAFWVFRE